MSTSLLRLQEVRVSINARQGINLFNFLLFLKSCEEIWPMLGIVLDHYYNRTFYIYKIHDIYFQVKQAGILIENGSAFNSYIHRIPN